MSVLPGYSQPPRRRRSRSRGTSCPQDARAAAGPDSLLRDREAALAGARRELDNIAAAIRQGSRTPATLVAMLDEAEATRGIA